ncbi:uncharacterized protein LOC141638464 [Silene latifolia]|uniref:uncharacterized protein LOC141638464 n=1 Tax=Silene latifolia TaxID=37657 RepID=UPI003D782252
MAALEETNAASDFTLFINPNITSNLLCISRFYVCFDALKQGWLLGCRRILSVDACFLKTFLGGQLIAAVGRDGNEQMYPLAWAVVEGENHESYEWFFKQSSKSIVAMVAKEFPRAEHRHCARHIFANWHKTYKGEDMKILFWACAKSYNEPDFNEALDNLKEVDPKVFDAFIACNPTLFCRAFIQKHTQNDVIVSNMSETFNAYIISARSKHLIYMLEEIRTLIMQRLVREKIEMEGSSHVVCPKVQERLEIEKDKASMCKALPSRPTLFQVHIGIDHVTVDLEARTCTCKKWELTGIPCFHAVSAIFEVHGHHAEDYVSRSL